jgi:tRNA G10  N-methylase Trm11
MFEVWAIGSSVPQLLESLSAYTTTSEFSSFIQNETGTFKLCLETSKTARMKYKRELVQKCFDVLKDKWKLQMASSKYTPQHIFWIIDYLSPINKHHNNNNHNIQNNNNNNNNNNKMFDLKSDHFICFVRQISFSTRKELITKLKEQPFRGPTSTDAELALIMANQALVLLSLTLITTPLLPLWIHFRLIDFDEDE